MKKYSTIEMLDLYTKNTFLQFECVEHEHLMFLTGKKIGKIDTSLSWLNGGHDSQSLNITPETLNAKWVLLDTKVDFITAVKMFNEGKTIYSRTNSVEHIYDGSFTYRGLMNVLEDESGNAISTKEILEGKWYIKEN